MRCLHCGERLKASSLCSSVLAEPPPFEPIFLDDGLDPERSAAILMLQTTGQFQMCQAVSAEQMLTGLRFKVSIEVSVVRSFTQSKKFVFPSFPHGDHGYCISSGIPLVSSDHEDMYQ